MALPPQQFCVRWNSYHTNLQAVFPRLLLTEQFADVTLACESRQLRCHKLVLSACSAYLERLLLQNPCKHPIVLMRDMRFSEMQALVDFMYKGEVNVTQEELPSLLKSAEALQIRGLCSGEGGGAGGAEGADASRDFTLASDALLHAHRSNAHPQQPQQQPASKPLHSTSNGPKKRKSEEREREKAEVKEETVEEDGLYYGELDNDHLEYNEDDETGKPGSSLGQSSEFAIANVQCQYECSDTEAEERPSRGPGASAAAGDHNYDTRDEPPAFIIHQLPTASSPRGPFVEVRPGLLKLAPSGAPAVNVIQLAERAPDASPADCGLNKRIRRSEGLLRQAADCVSRGSTFQTVSEQFNIPISTIRFFMARKGILPRRRRGRNSQLPRACSSPEEPPFHMQHFKLPDMLALQADAEPPA
ncbi:protein bric-a-brac 2-like isoform X5 [Maniola jurtina]|uniref:protein bric-a-brac 2-like isoform X5 n=1 Tax=Maniola jurtina TaxID=191418 RepID=UPI001E68917A|nr:protein bric-a-brac 2-like isoform X5 [Maniola jurtina]